MSNKKISVKYTGYAAEEIDFNIPNYCPHCGRTIVPEIIYPYTDSNRDGYSLVCIYSRCTAEECRRFFSLEYEICYTNYNFNTPVLINYDYKPPIKVELPEDIESVSPSFVKIYGQATEAESYKLDQIAGVGYRKAAEFLIKDYAIMKNPNKIDKIRSMTLGSVIAEFLKDFPKVQSLAKALSWIGNDETHYVRIHTDKDIGDLKRFIHSTAQFIAADFHVDLAIQFTSKKI